MTGLYNRPRSPEPDYSHALHAQACQLAAQSAQVLNAHVLTRKGQVVYCARIVSPYSAPGRPDCWRVQALWPEQCEITVLVRNTIECDARYCSCIAAPAAAPGVSA
jgi:hypothetical protein